MRRGLGSSLLKAVIAEEDAGDAGAAHAACSSSILASQDKL